MVLFFIDLDVDLNQSLQIGDLIYACDTRQLGGAQTEQYDTIDSNGMGNTNIVGILRKVDVFLSARRAKLFIDNSMFSDSYLPQNDDFIMFSKYREGDAGVLGYYADIKLVNNSKEKAELFAVSSEVIINSK